MLVEMLKHLFQVAHVTVKVSGEHHHIIQVNHQRVIYQFSQAAVHQL